MTPVKRRAGLTLIEITAALLIAAAVATLGIQYLRVTDRTSKQRSCDMTRQLLQNDLQRYLDNTGRLPRADLRELRSDEYAGQSLPSCPVTGQSYRCDRSGTVGCPTHEATRGQ